MSRLTFFNRRGPLGIAALTEATGAVAPAGTDRTLMFSDIAPVSEAGPDEVTFVLDRRRLSNVKDLRAGACFIPASLAGELSGHTVPLSTELPEVAFAIAIGLFYPDAVRSGGRSGAEGPSVVDPSARLGQGVEIEPGAVIGAEVEIGANTLICANAVICRGVKIGRNCVIGQGASVMHALVGNDVLVHPGARIGQDGFGYAQGARGFVKIPQIGRVILQDHVEVGANATIDRGALADTVIGEGTKIDNLVQIGHNVSIGRSCVVVAQAGVSGSVRAGDGVLIGGQAGINPHVDIGSGAQVGPQCGVDRDVKPGIRILGSPYRPVDRFVQELRAVRRLVWREQRAREGEGSSS